MKITGSVSPSMILHTTFIANPVTTPGQPAFYQLLDTCLSNPAWFYLSASPYNLYPFLHAFIATHYPRGTLILRETSLMYLDGLLQSLTQGVQAYKVSRMDKIHTWLPSRRVVCVGNSTQSDPEAYAEIYRKYPGWVKAIFIKKVLYPPPLAGKNEPERFEIAFQGVPASVWRVFEMPEELKQAVDILMSSIRSLSIPMLQKICHHTRLKIRRTYHKVACKS